MDTKIKLDSLPQLEIKVSEKGYVLDYSELEIARETIDENMIEQSSLYAYYAVLAEMLDEIVGTLKLELNVLEAQLYSNYKKKALEEPGVKITDKAIDSEVKRDKDYMAAVLILNEAKKNCGIFKAITKAFEHRKEMLINLGAKYRKEMDADITFKSKK